MGETSNQKGGGMIGAVTTMKDKAALEIIINGAQRKGAFLSKEEIERNDADDLALKRAKEWRAQRFEDAKNIEPMLQTESLKALMASMDTMIFEDVPSAKVGDVMQVNVGSAEKMKFVPFRIKTIISSYDHNVPPEDHWIYRDQIVTMSKVEAERCK